MFNANKPNASELPSNAQLVKSTGIAAVVAGALLVLVVLPAEYGVDPTGAGSILGLTEMGRIKMSLAQEAKADAAADAAIAEAATTTTPTAPLIDVPAPADDATPAKPGPPPATVSSPQLTAPAAAAPQLSIGASDESTLTLAPDQGGEIKLSMKKGARATFEWSTNGPGVNYDTHGDGPGINYQGYGKGTNVDQLKGELVAAFDGSHGWFWRNRTDGDVTITLRTKGEYSELKTFE